MRSIAHTSCRVSKCNNPGKLMKSGRRQFPRGYCSKHYHRMRNGISLDTKTVYDKRPAIIEGDTARIPLGINAKDGYAIVDADMAWIDKYWWSLSKRGYAVTNINLKQVTMHRLILQASSKVIYDHINRDKLDNRKKNLRECSQTLNSANRAIQSNNNSGYKGVKTNNGRRWYAQIAKDGVHYHISGGYKTPEEAARKYDEVALELFGEFACLNFPKNKTPQ